MNKVIEIGRITNTPSMKYSNGATPMAIANYSIAVPRKGTDNKTDFFKCVAFGKQGEFAEKYLKKGMKICIIGHLQTNNYTTKDGNKINEVVIVVDEHEFVDSKTKTDNDINDRKNTETGVFMNIPEDVYDDLPFN